MSMELRGKYLDTCVEILSTGPRMVRTGFRNPTESRRAASAGEVRPWRVFESVSINFGGFVDAIGFAAIFVRQVYRSNRVPPEF
jgi:hypothetical protein